MLSLGTSERVSVLRQLGPADLVDCPKKTLLPVRSGRRGYWGGQEQGRERELGLVYKIKNNKFF